MLIFILQQSQLSPAHPSVSGEAASVATTNEKIVCRFLFLCCLPDLACDPPYASRFPARLQLSASFCPDTYRVSQRTHALLARRLPLELARDQALPHSIHILNKGKKDGCLKTSCGNLILILTLPYLIITEGCAGPIFLRI